MRVSVSVGLGNRRKSVINWNCYNMDMFKLRYKQEYSADLSKNIIATAS